jgi:hypothetical protein
MKTIQVKDIPADAWRFLQSLDLSRDEIVLEQDGKPQVVVTSAQVLEQRRRAKEQLFAVVDRIRQRNPGLDSDALLEELEELDHPDRKAS